MDQGKEEAVATYRSKSPYESMCEGEFLYNMKP